MKKLAFLMFTVSLLFTFYPSIVHCTVINELEAKRHKGDAISVMYEYELGLVYNSIRHIIRHSENKCISKQYGEYHTDFAPEEKAIYNYDGNAGIGVFISQVTDKKTKVDFVYTDGFLNRNLKCSVDSIIEELPFLLENRNIKKYLEYTQKLRKKKDKERAGQ